MDYLNHNNDLPNGGQGRNGGTKIVITPPDNNGVGDYGVSAPILEQDEANGSTRTLQQGIITLGYHKAVAQSHPSLFP